MTFVLISFTTSCSLYFPHDISNNDNETNQFYFSVLTQHPSRPPHPVLATLISQKQPDSPAIKYRRDNVCQTYSLICLRSICNYNISSTTLRYNSWILSSDIILLRVDGEPYLLLLFLSSWSSNEWFIHCLLCRVSDWMLFHGFSPNLRLCQMQLSRCREDGWKGFLPIEPAVVRQVKHPGT